MELNFYKQPFHQDRFGDWVYDAKSNFVFQFEETEKYDKKGRYSEGVKELREQVLLSLNSLNHEPLESLELVASHNDPCLILNHLKPFIVIRGWGGLTGTGGHNFSSEKASKIQDDFKHWIIYKLTKR